MLTEHGEIELRCDGRSRLQLRCDGQSRFQHSKVRQHEFFDAAKVIPHKCVLAIDFMLRALFKNLSRATRTAKVDRSNALID